MTPAVCRVDFINPILGKELINLVTEWHAGLKRPIIVAPWVIKLRTRKASVGRVIKYSMPFFVGLLCLGVFRWLFSDLVLASPVTNAVFEKFGLWLVLSFGGVFAAFVVGAALAEMAVNDLARLAISNVAFSLTNGDENEALIQVAKSNKRIRKFFFKSAWSLAINVVAAYLAYRLGIGSVAP